MLAFRETSPWHVRAVLLDLSAPDRMELASAFGEVDANRIVPSWLAGLGAAFLAGTYCEDHEPLAILMLVPTGPVSLTANLLSRPAFRRHARMATRHMLRELRPQVLAGGWTRIEARAHARHATARRWLKFLGAHPEAEIRGLSVDGAPFIQFAWWRLTPAKETGADVLLQQA